MNKHFKILSCLNIPNAITIMSVILSITSLFLITNGNIKAGLLLYGYCFLCDKLDGYFARKLNQTSAIGIQMDSLSDFFSFGAYPVLCSMMLYGSHIFLWICGALYMAGAALRLAYFNVHGMEEDHQHFTGIPSTLAGAIMYFCITIVYKSGFNYAEIALSVMLLLLGLAMVSSLKFNKYGMLAKAFIVMVIVTMVLSML